MDIIISDRVKSLNSMLCEIEKIYQLLLSAQKLTDSEYVLLFHILAMGEGCSQKDIVESTHISKKTLNSTVKKLEQDELITLKAGKYPNMLLYLTEKGKNFIRERMLPIIEIENELTKNIKDADFEVFSDIVSKYIDISRHHLNI